WFLFTSAGRVTFFWLFPIPVGDLISAGHMLFLLSYSNIFHLCHSYSQTMVELHFNNDHNKVAYLLKLTESLGFHQILDFMNGLYIRYALTANPTIYASVVRQFWGSASEVCLPNGVRGLVATIDGTAYTITEASIRSALQLDNLNSIDPMTNDEIFAGL
nr:xylulose kinase-1 [Tanacetum cinerariifolium]